MSSDNLGDAFIKFGESLGLNFVDARSGEHLFIDNDKKENIDLAGKYARATIYTDDVEDAALEQIKTLIDQPFAENSNPRFMPDVHAGKGCTVGTTMRITDKVVPNLVGVDIGCGVEVVPIDNEINEDDLKRLDDMLKEGKVVPSGFSHRTSKYVYCDAIEFDKLHTEISESDMTSLGSLGGGNHFIEIDKNASGQHFLVVHTGSRSLGLKVCIHHQGIATSLNDGSVPIDLSYLTGSEMQDYLDDMRIAQEFATWNRHAICDEIVGYMGWTIGVGGFTTIHNYIDLDNMILRKGAISAQLGEKIIIPMNMRDGSIIALGKGNAEWNYSAPHGAGRLMSRTEARNKLSVLDFQHQMSGIYTTCVNTQTLDESPMAYKPMENIVKHIKDTADIIDIIKPIYNFKAN